MLCYLQHAAHFSGAPTGCEVGEILCNRGHFCTLDCFKYNFHSSSARLQQIIIPLTWRNTEHQWLATSEGALTRSQPPRSLPHTISRSCRWRQRCVCYWECYLRLCDKEPLVQQSLDCPDKPRLSPKVHVLPTFYTGTIVSILSSNITTWFGNCIISEYRVKLICQKMWSSSKSRTLTNIRIAHNIIIKKSNL